MQTLSGSIASRVGEAHSLGASTIAALSLFAANVGVLLIYFVLDLTLYQLIVVYWWEALWIGLFSGLKLLVATLIGDPYENRWVDVSTGGGLLFTLFALAKSSGTFLAIVMLTGVAIVVANEGLTGTPGNDFVAAQVPVLIKCSLLFFVGHGLSFIINFLVLGEFRRARAGALLALPFKRASALLVTIAIAVTAIQAWPGVVSSTGFAATLITIKLAWDYFLHTRERRAFAARGMSHCEVRHVG
ncbi:MAG: DUF6498-containing protein [Pseudomonadota bacterium]